MKQALIAIFILLSLITQPSALTSESTQSNSEFDCFTLYFFNGIVVYNSTITEDLLLETPRNISLPNGFTQTVEHLVYYNVAYNETQGAFEFTVEGGKGFEGFILSRVKLCTKPLRRVLDYIKSALQNPNYNPSESEIGQNVPSDVREKYVEEPSKIIVEVVVPEYESWFKSRYGISITNATSLGIAVTAAYFIYIVYIEYNPEATPRSIEDVVKSRKGDCDDMSRVLVELLNYYNIPAVIINGYTVIENFNYTIPVENVTYKFINNGPHAFTAVYVQGLGWISIDLLAGSLIIYPFVIEEYTRETHVPSEAVENFIELHRAINATQVIAVFTENTIRNTIGENITLNAVYEYFKGVVEELAKGRQEYTTTQTPRTPNTTSPLSPIRTITETPETKPTTSEIEEFTTQMQKPFKTSNLLWVITLLALIVILILLSYIILYKQRTCCRQ